MFEQPANKFYSASCDARSLNFLNGWNGLNILNCVCEEFNP